MEIIVFMMFIGFIIAVIGFTELMDSLKTRKRNSAKTQKLNRNIGVQKRNNEAALKRYFRNEHEKLQKFKGGALSFPEPEDSSGSLSFPMTKKNKN